MGTDDLQGSYNRMNGPNWHYWATYCNFVTEDGIKCSEFGKHLERGTTRCPKCKWWTAIGYKQSRTPSKLTE